MVTANFILIFRNFMQYDSVPLEVAVKNGHAGTVQILLEAEANVNRQRKVKSLCICIHLHDEL